MVQRGTSIIRGCAPPQDPTVATCRECDTPCTLNPTPEALDKQQHIHNTQHTNNKHTHKQTTNWTANGGCYRLLPLAIVCYILLRRETAGLGTLVLFCGPGVDARTPHSSGWLVGMVRAPQTTLDPGPCVPTPKPGCSAMAAAAAVAAAKEATAAAARCERLIVPPFRGSSRFESLILSHHSRRKVVCECNE